MKKKKRTPASKLDDSGNAKKVERAKLSDLVDTSPTKRKRKVFVNRKVDPADAVIIMRKKKKRKK